MFGATAFLILCITELGFIHSIPIDNGVEGEPEIECGPATVEVHFNTRNPFEGHVYVKGQFQNSACKSDKSGRNTAAISLPFESCGVRRTRSLNPRGIYVSATVVISFHPQFETKVDRAYMVQCFYMEADKTVSSDMDVSMLTTVFQTQLVPMPICKYEILEGGKTGQPVRFALVGQQVYHKWSCDTETSDLFCMLVHTCYVDDGNGDKVTLLDDNGCAQDNYLLRNLEYLTDLMAGQESHVFKYADRAQVFFQCQISIVIKEPNQQCTRPQCAEPSANAGPGGAPLRNALPAPAFNVDSSAIATSSQSNIPSLSTAVNLSNATETTTAAAASATPLFSESSTSTIIDTTSPTVWSSNDTTTTAHGFSTPALSTLHNLSSIDPFVPILTESTILAVDSTTTTASSTNGSTNAAAPFDSNALQTESTNSDLTTEATVGVSNNPNANEVSNSNSRRRRPAFPRKAAHTQAKLQSKATNQNQSAPVFANDSSASKHHGQASRRQPVGAADVDVFGGGSYNPAGRRRRAASAFDGDFVGVVDVSAQLEPFDLPTDGHAALPYHGSAESVEAQLRQRQSFDNRNVCVSTLGLGLLSLGVLATFSLMLAACMAACLRARRANTGK